MRTYGSVDLYVYKEYFKAGGRWYVALGVAMMFLLAQLFASAGDYFVAQWQVSRIIVVISDRRRFALKFLFQYTHN